MNYAYLHLVLVHIPAIGIVFGLLLLLVAVAKKSEELKRVTLGAFVIIALVTIPVYLTGEPAEELVERLPGVSESIIDDHEDSGLVSLAAAELTGLMALGGLFLFRRSRAIPGWFITAMLILSVGSTGSMMRTAHLGGEIRHTEIRSEPKGSTPADQTLADKHKSSERESKGMSKKREDDSD